MNSELALLEKRIEDVVEAVKAVRAKLDKALPEPAKRWRGNEGHSYWYVDDVEGVTRSYEDSHEADDLRYCIGNYFETEHECEQYLKNLKTKQKLKDLALELNDGREIDWTNRTVAKHYIKYNYGARSLESATSWELQSPGQVYCLDMGFLTRAIMEIGKDDLINLIKSGV